MVKPYFLAVSMLVKRRVSEQTKSCEMVNEDISMGSTYESIEPTNQTDSSTSECHFPSSQDSVCSILESKELSGGSSQEAAISKSGSGYEKSITRKCNESKKKARNNQGSQLSLRSFFQKSTNLDNGVNNSCTDHSNNQAEPSQPDPHLRETSTAIDHSSRPKQCEVNTDACDLDLAELNDRSRKEEKSNVASLEWQRIQQMMQNSIPLCKGHKERCIARVVKKQGSNFGRRFYVCARAEVICFTLSGFGHHCTSNSLKTILLHYTVIPFRIWPIFYIVYNPQNIKSCSSERG